MLCALYVRGGAAWVLGFGALVPWLLCLRSARSTWESLANAWAMTVAFTAVAFGWFGAAIGSVAHVGSAAGVVVLLLLAPVFQPQFLAFALASSVTRGQSAALRSFASVAAWIAVERFVPKVLGDTLGHGLYPSMILRQAADLFGTAGLTALLLLSNEAIAVALVRRAEDWRSIVRPLGLAAAAVVVVAGYGRFELSRLSPANPTPLRMGLVQANIVDYEAMRHERGALAVVREVLDTHYAMTYDAVERRRAQAVLWSETVYPTTFGHPKSDVGGELDNEVLGIVNAAGVPFVFGTYDRDEKGEYNAAAFVSPGVGLIGFYRKTRLFPLTEYLPAWLDGPTVRRWLPWAGSWQPGSGARVFPLKLADGRDIPVQPLICLDDVDTSLAVDGARLGAQALLVMSNDRWFTDHPIGAQLHLNVAAFRSIETRLPQFRVTTNGYSAVIDADGSILAGTRMGERTLVIGDLPVGEPPRTLVVAWGDWLGVVAAGFLAMLALLAAARWWRTGHTPAEGASAPPLLPANVAVLSRPARVGAGLLRVFARMSLLGMIVAVLIGVDDLRTNTLAQIRVFVALFIAPEAAAWFVLRAFAARASVEQGKLVLARGVHRLELALADIVALEAWRIPIPGQGASVRLASGKTWSYGLYGANADRWAVALNASGASVSPPDLRSRLSLYEHARLAVQRPALARPWIKFGLFPLLLAMPAFRLHQHIAYGSAFGEYQTFGAAAYLTAFVLWWSSWAIGVVLFAAAVRTVIEAGTLLVALARPAVATKSREWLERLGLIVMYAGLPAFLLLRVV